MTPEERFKIAYTLWHLAINNPDYCYEEREALWADYVQARDQYLNFKNRTMPRAEA